MVAKNCWLVENGGETRQVWGPYTVNQAMEEKGTRHMIVRGHGLSNGKTFTRGIITEMIKAGSISPVEEGVVLS